MTNTGMPRLLALAGAAVLSALPGLGAAKDITIVRELDSNNYDPHKSTALAAAEILFMLGDTLVSLKPDMKTLDTGLAKSWEMSEDGLTYTFHLRDDVSFCSGKKFTAEDVVYSFNRWVDPETKSPVAWRAGKVESVTAPDDYTVVYKLTQPYSELLYQLTMSFATIIDKDEVAALGPDFGVKGFNGTGPFCWGSWTPRNTMEMVKHEGYTWGPGFYENQGPAKIDKIIWQNVPEENTRTVAMITGQTQITPYIPYIAFEKLRAMPNIKITTAEGAAWTNFLGFKIDKPMVKDLAVREAINLAFDQKAFTEDLYYGEVRPAYSYISPTALDWNDAVDSELLTYDVEKAKALLDEAGWVVGSDGIREKDGVKLQPLLYAFAGSNWKKVYERVQGDLRKVGIDLQVQAFDATIAWGKIATQEFDMFTMGYPYLSAGDAMNLYFRSSNIPTPNRMNWNDPETDTLLDAGMTALSDEARAQAYGEVLMKVHKAATWLPLYHKPISVVQSTDLAPITVHSIYGCPFYKGLELAYVD